LIRRNKKGQFIKGKLVEKQCLNCSKVYSVVPSRKTKTKFCSQSCSAKFRKPHSEHKKPDKIAICKGCGITFTFRGTRKRQFCTKRCAFLFNINKLANDPKVKAKQSAAKKNKTYTQIHGGNAKNMISKRRKQAKTNNNWKYAKNYRKSPNKIEKEFMVFLNKNWPNQYKFTGNKYNFVLNKKPDFTHVSEKKIIEIFGDYWHKGDNPQDYIDYYKAFGYNCLIFWEHEINNNLAHVLEEIKKW
jgi:very-short-patch-repair endonuclease